MWTTTPLLEGGVLVAFISLSCMPEYQKWSHEVRPFCTLEVR